MRHTNIIVIKNIIILKKVREKEKLSENIADITVLAKMAQTSSLVDLTQKYKWAISNSNMDVAKNWN